MVASRQPVEEVCRLCQPFCAPAALRFFFYSNEGRPLEPPHVHVEQGEREAKFWLRPEVYLAYNDGLSARALRELLALVEGNRERIEKAWNEFFG